MGEMSSIEKIRRYIERTHIPPYFDSAYNCSFDDLYTISQSGNNWHHGILLAFRFGRCKGFRAGVQAGLRVHEFPEIL